MRLLAVAVVLTMTAGCGGTDEAGEAPSERGSHPPRRFWVSALQAEPDSAGSRYFLIFTDGRYATNWFGKGERDGVSCIPRDAGEQVVGEITAEEKHRLASMLSQEAVQGYTLDALEPPANGCENPTGIEVAVMSNPGGELGTVWFDPMNPDLSERTAEFLTFLDSLGDAYSAP